MPSRTKKQARAMRAACYSKKQKEKGIPRHVACKYVRADKKAGKRK